MNKPTNTFNYLVIQSEIAYLANDKPRSFVPPDGGLFEPGLIKTNKTNPNEILGILNQRIINCVREDN